MTGRRMTAKITGMIGNYLFDVSDCELFAFQCGYLTGALVALIFVLVLGLLLTVLRCPHRARGVLLPSAHGRILISATAIADLVKSVGTEFPAIEILKVGFYHDRRKTLRLTIAVSFPYNPDGDSIVNVSENFETRLLDALQHNLGVENIGIIEINVRKGKPKPGFY